MRREWKFYVMRLNVWKLGVFLEQICTSDEIKWRNMMRY